MPVADAATPYRLRPATDADFMLIHRWREAGLRSYVELLWGWEDADQLQRFRDRFDPTKYHVIQVDRCDVGALSVSEQCGEVFIADVEIDAAHRNRGLGSAVVRDVIAAAHRAGRSVALQVLTVNPARRLYERLGFCVTHQSATHIHMRCDPPSRHEDTPPRPK